MRTYKVFLKLDEKETVCVFSGLSENQAIATCNALNEKQPNCYFVK